MKTTAVVTMVLVTLILGGRPAPSTSLLLEAAPPVPASETSPDPLQEAAVEGTWVTRTSEEGIPRLHLRRERRNGDGWRAQANLPQNDVRRIVEEARARDGVVDVTLERAAGTLTLEGLIRGERGGGTFTFRAAPAFATRMQELGFRRPDVDELLAAAAFGVDESRVAMLRNEGFDPDFDEVLATAMFGVDRDFVQEARARWGTVRLDDVLAMKIHGIDGDAVQDAVEAGLGSLDLDDVVAMRIHGVDTAFLHGMAAAGYPMRDLDDALAFRIHGITPAWVEELREKGFEDLDADDLLNIRIHGLDRILRKRRR